MKYVAAFVPLVLFRSCLCLQLGLCVYLIAVVILIIYSGIVSVTIVYFTVIIIFTGKLTLIPIIIQHFAKLMPPAMLFMITRLHWQIHAAIITAVRNKKTLMQTSGDREVEKKGEKLRREHSNPDAQQSCVKIRGCLRDKKNRARDKREGGGGVGPGPGSPRALTLSPKS